MNTVANTFTGTISRYMLTPQDDSINAASFILRNTTSGVETWVNIPRGAKLLDSNGAINLLDLNDGMTVSIKGSGTSGAYIRAETITISLAIGSTGGILTVTATDAITPLMMDVSGAPGWQFVKNRAAGATDQILASFIVKAGSSGSAPINISRITINDAMSETTTLAAGSIVNLKLFKSDGSQLGASVVKMTQQTGSDVATAIFSGLNIQVPAGGSEKITVRGDINTYPNIAPRSVHKFGVGSMQATNSVSGAVVTVAGLPIYDTAQRVYRSALSAQNTELLRFKITSAPDQVIGKFRFTNSSPGNYSASVSDITFFNTKRNINFSTSTPRYVSLKLDSPTGTTIARKRVYQHQGGWGSVDDWGAPPRIYGWDTASAPGEIPLSPFAISATNGFGFRDVYVLTDMNDLQQDPTAYIQMSIMDLRWSDGVVSDVLKGWGAGLAVGTTASVSTVADSDVDKDGFSDAKEGFIVTNALSACGENAWPPDIDNDKKITILDTLAVAGSVMSGNVPGYTLRHDLNPDGVIDQKDVDVVTGNYGKTCTVIVDTEPPTTPIGLSATAISSSQIQLSWTPSNDNVFVLGYRIFRCASSTGSTCTPVYTYGVGNVTSFTDTSLTANTSYTYSLIAKDYAQNESSQSTPTNATTLSTGDFDTDGDGFSDRIETFIGTDQTKACGVNAWPADIDNSKRIDIFDVQSVLNALGATAGATNYRARYDLNMDSSITQADADIIYKYYSKTCSL